MLIELDRLSKVYENGTTGISDLTLEIRDGIFGLLGPNGAGKTTLMRILATLLDPTSGTARIDGHDVRRRRPEIRRILGYLPQNAGFYPQLTTEEYLDYVGLLYGLPGKKRKAAVESALERVNLEEQRRKRISHLSGGMRQRLGIAQAVLAEPGLLIVDEPTAGLDPEERIRVRNLLTQLAGDRVIILSTHIVADIAGSASRIAVMNRGSIVFHGSASELVDQAAEIVWLCTLAEEQVAEVSRLFRVTDLQRTSQGIQARILDEDPNGKQPAYQFTPAAPNLEDAYVWIMRDAASNAEPAVPGRL